MAQIIVKYWCSKGFVILWSFFPLISFSQNFDSFKKMRQKEIDSSLSFKFDSKKLQWLSLAPSFSYNKTTGFNASISAASFVRYIQQRHRNTIERERYIFEQKNRLENEILRIEDRILELTASVKLLGYQSNNTEILFKKYQIALSSFENNEISYSQFLDAKYSYSSAWSTQFSKYDNLRAKILAFSTKYDISLTFLSLELNSSFNRLKSIKP